MLIALGVIFIPFLLDGAGYRQQHQPIPKMPPEPELPTPLPINDSPIELKAAPPPEPAPEPDVAEDEQGGEQLLSGWVVQLGSFENRANARKLTASLKDKGFAAFIETVESGTKPAFRVRIGPELTRAEADTVRKRLKRDFKRDGVLMRYRGPAR